jgi:hypothetical protein
MYAPPRATWPAAAHASNGGRACRRPSAVGTHGRGASTAEGRLRAWAPSSVRAPRPTCLTAPRAPTFAPPRAPRSFAFPRSRPTAAHAPRAPTFAPPVHAPRAPTFAPPVHAPQDVHAHGSRSRPTACVPLEYKFIKIVVHSTTWASRPSTTVRWMTAGCLGGDHSFLIHSHGPRAHPRTRLYACLI